MVTRHGFPVAVATCLSKRDEISSGEMGGTLQRTNSRRKNEIDQWSLRKNGPQTFKWTRMWTNYAAWTGVATVSWPKRPFGVRKLSIDGPVTKFFFPVVVILFLATFVF